MNRKKRETPPIPAKITGEVETHIIATACIAVPEGRQHLARTFLADKIVQGGLVDSIAIETVCRTLKKQLGQARTTDSPWRLRTLGRMGDLIFRKSYGICLF